MRRLALALLVAFACGGLHALTYSNAYVSPRNGERARRAATTFIILHTTEGEAKPSLRKLSKNGEAHYCVDRDGTVYRIVDRSRVAYHCGVSMWRGRRNLDDVSVGIEVVGYHDRALTRAQYAALRELVLTLQKIYGVKDANVMPHAQVAYGTPNRWHPRSHRGRKRCGMGYATPAVRKLLGLDERWLADPDVKARRLVVGDAYLAQVLYDKRGERLLPYKLPGAAAGKAKTPARAAAGPRVYTIAKGQTAWDVARDAYNAAGTLYIFPDGRRVTGDRVRHLVHPPHGRLRARNGAEREDAGRPAARYQDFGGLRRGRARDQPPAARANLPHAVGRARHLLPNARQAVAAVGRD